MARRMVTERWPSSCLAAVAISLFGLSACSSFDPVHETHFTLLYQDTYDALGMPGAHWVAYDEQHSASAACTNGAAGNHLSKECSEVYAPWTEWTNPKCSPTAQELSEGYLADPGANGSICIQGVLRPTLACAKDHRPAQCFEANGLDVSNMWGAGVGLSFSQSGKQAWSAPAHKVRGVAFDFSGSEETRLNLRVEVPILLDPESRVSSDRPLMRSDGSVLGTDGNVYDCDTDQIVESDSGVDRSKTTLKDALVGDQEGDPVSSERHPYGSPFWQLPSANPSWGSSPVQVGHNEFAWTDIQPPPEPRPDPNNYPFKDAAQILGVHFQVVPPSKGNKTDFQFAFCIRKLALLLED